MNHVFDCFLVIFAKVNHARLSFAELVAACTVEETGAGAQDGAMHRPLFRVAPNSQVGVFTTEVKTTYTLV